VYIVGVNKRKTFLFGSCGKLNIRLKRENTRLTMFLEIVPVAKEMFRDVSRQHS
jgi:hypothetical protein